MDSIFVCASYHPPPPIYLDTEEAKIWKTKLNGIYEGYIENNYVWMNDCRKNSSVEALLRNISESIQNVSLDIDTSTIEKNICNLGLQTERLADYAEEGVEKLRDVYPYKRRS